MNKRMIFFKAMISDGLRHGSSLAGKHMADLREYYADPEGYYNNNDNNDSDDYNGRRDNSSYSFRH